MLKSTFYILVLLFVALIVDLTSPRSYAVDAIMPAPKCTVQKAEVMMTEGDSVWTEVIDVCM